METLRKDVRYAIRTLRKAPGFTIIAVLALGLGIGANSAIFSVFNGILWRPLPVKSPQQLVSVTRKSPGVPFAMNLSYPDWEEYRKLTGVFDGLMCWSATPVNLGEQGRPERVWADMVSGNYFSVLGLEAARGRVFASGEGWVPGKDAVAVLSYKFWQKRFGGDDRAIGQTMQINQHPFTIIGVLPERFHGAYYFIDADFYVPITEIAILDPADVDPLHSRSATFLRAIGRLQPGVTPEKAMAAAQPADQRLATEFPDADKSLSLWVLPELESRPEPGFGGFMVTAFAVFMLLVGMVLLIACANVANLILARANGRRKEMATRTALGASRWRMVRQLLTESTVLALLGGAAGMGLARWAELGLTRIRVPGDIPLHLFDLSMDWRIFGFSLLAAIATGVAAGLVPAVQASRTTNLADVLKAGGRSGGGLAGHQGFRNALVIAQVAVSLLLLACAGFFIRSLENSAHADMGFRADHTLMMSVDLGLQGYKEAQGQQFYRQLRDRVKSLSGVDNAAVTAFIPMGYDNSLANIYPEGQILDPSAKAESAFVDMVQPSYFGTLGVPVIKGREFTENDDAKAPPVAIVNQFFSDKIWPGQDPIGKVFRTERNGPAIQVVGVTRTGKYAFLYEPPQMFAYFPLAQRYSSSATLLVHTTVDPQQLVAPVREQVREMDPGLPVYSVGTMEAHVKYGKPLFPARLAAIFVGAFGLLGLVLASVGVYGVVSCAVGQRTQEIGIRTALGAQRSAVLGMILKQGMAMAAMGTGIGFALAFVVFRAIRSVLYGVRSTDLLTMSSVSLLLLAVAFLASYIPAMRATRIDPVVALRDE